MKEVVLCGANSYTQKFYFNQEFASLPESVRQELQIMCVTFTEDVGGSLTLRFDEDGRLQLDVWQDSGDYLFDEIGAEYKIRRIQSEKQELFSQLEQFGRLKGLLDEGQGQ